MLIRRMDGVASLYRLATSLHPASSCYVRTWSSTAGDAYTRPSPCAMAASTGCARVWPCAASSHRGHSEESANSPALNPILQTLP